MVVTSGQNLPSTNNMSEIPPSPLKVTNVEPISSLIRKLLPLAAFFMAFTTVMTVLIVYMDNTGNPLYSSSIFKTSSGLKLYTLNIASEFLEFTKKIICFLPY